MKPDLPLVYSCSGCSSAAQMANSLALRLDRDEAAEMSCIAGVGGGVAPLVRLAQSGRRIIALDGCALACVRHCLARHGVTPDMIKRVRAAGHTPSSEMLIAFRIHGVTPDFIDEVRKLGFEHPQPEQLLSMRIHGVTPEYIGEMQGRGVKNLTIDKLVAMKIHGLD